MARMLGRKRSSWCPYCNGPPGPDCPDVGKDTRHAKREEQREVRREIQEDACSDGTTAGSQIPSCWW